MIADGRVEWNSTLTDKDGNVTTQHGVTVDPRDNPGSETVSVP